MDLTLIWFLLVGVLGGVPELTGGARTDGGDGPGALVFVAERVRKDLAEFVFGKADELPDEAQTVEHPALELVRGGHKVPEQHFEDFALAGVCSDQVVKLDVPGLPDPVDAAHPLF